MSLIAPVENGKVVETTSQNSLKNTAKSSNNSMDKDAFLQLLVAQMKYQDPLQPTSNTEYVSQYAQFSQVEQMQNMAASMDLSRASSLVGQEVYVRTVDSSGKSKMVQGRVDYVVYENNKAYLSINEQLYSIDDLDSVVDSAYQSAFDKAYDFAIKMNRLPHVNGIDMSDAKTIDELEKTYNEMSEYEKTFVAKDYVDLLNKYVDRLKEIRAAAGEDSGNVEGGEDVEDSEGTENGEDVEDSEGTDGSGESTEGN